MIVLGNHEFTLGMRFCGVKNSYVIEDRAKALELIKSFGKDEFIIANAKVVELVPELKKFPNLATIPDDVNDFDTIEDLKYIIKTAVGIELEVV